jgi:hypothetical protein
MSREIFPIQSKFGFTLTTFQYMSFIVMHMILI